MLIIIRCSYTYVIKYHTINDDGTIELQEFEYSLSESKIRTTQLIFSVHLEFDLSDNYYDKEKNRYYDRRNKSWRIGLGGFFGFRLGTKQYLKYTDENGIDYKIKQKGNFNSNLFNYGVSGYVAYRTMGIYIKYDINELFKNTDLNNFSLALRFDFD